MPPQTPIPADLLCRPFLVEDARAVGLSAEVLRGRRFRRLFRGVYVSADLPRTLALQVDAARLVLPADGRISHHTAAALRGLPVPATDQVHVTVPPGSPGPRVGGICTHRGDTSEVVVAGRRLSTPAENFLELAESLCLVDLVVLGDAMVGRGFVTCEELVHTCAATTRRRGVRMARRAAALVRSRVDSPMETRVRLLIVLSGLPEPTPNYVVRDRLGGWIGEVDLAYRSQRIAIEYHGDVHRAAAGRWRSDVAKAELLGGLGWRVIILTADDVRQRPGRTLRRVHEALVGAGHPAVPVDLDAAWREHFVRGAA